MNPFDDVRFHGSFRDYQQRVLDHAQDFLEDGRIHIVAAPGSGKTVLGLELIRRLASPCLILSPTTAIRAQWGERFRDLFLDGPDRFESLFSYDLHKPRLITCITYQALYSAVEKKSAESEDDPDCSDVDLFEAVRAAGITTVCLDEAHHLKNEWQKALEKFLSALEGKIRLIALTATPPYDSDGTEWSRYTDVCGEIDEEIFVPELVAQRTLCPHQDYVYFNYPTEAETRALQAHRERAKQALLQIGHLPWMGALCGRLNAERDFEKLFFAAEELIALLAFLQGLGYPVDRWLIRQMTARR